MAPIKIGARDKVEIAASGTTSTSIPLHGRQLTGIETPSALTGTSISFQVSADNTTFIDLKDDQGDLVSVTVAINAAGAYSADVSKTVAADSYPWIRVKSNDTEAAHRVLRVLSREIAQ